MTVSSTTARISYSGNGTSTIFAVPFYFLANSQLAVVLRSSAGVETPQVLGTNYTVTGAGVLTGGSITMTVAPPTGSTLVIARNVPLTQETDLQPNDRLPAETLEQAIDKLTMIAQQLDVDFDRALKYPTTDSTSITPVIPSSVDRAGKFLKFDNNGAPIAQSMPSPFVSVKDFGAVGDGQTDDTAAIQTAINTTAAAGQTLYFPAGTYRIVPATLKDWEGTPLGEGQMTVAFVMPSNMCVYGDVGATLKLANSVSTLAAPKRLALFFSNVPVSNIRFYGLTMDMNGLNNRFSPLAPTTFRLYNQAMIHITGTIGGVAARGDNVQIDSCKFLNTAGTSCIVMAQSNSVGVTLGKNWSVTNCLFKNNGLDTNDHSSIFAWANDVVCANNTFTADTMFPNGIVGNSGSFVAYEVHGRNQRFVNNLVENYWQGMWVASNLTSDADNIVIANNTFSPINFAAIDFFRFSAAESIIKKVLIDGNTIGLDDTVPPTGVLPTLKTGIQIAPFYKISDVQISNNIASKIGTSKASAFVNIVSQAAAANQAHSDIVIKNNYTNGYTFGVVLTTSAINGMGPVEITGNNFVNCLPATSFAFSQGIAVAGTASAYKNLLIGTNSFIDNQAVPTQSFGIRLDALITNLNVKPQNYQGMVVANYAETVSTVVTNRFGYYENRDFTPVWKVSGTPITVGNGISVGFFTINEKQITLNAYLKVGSTTSFGGGGNLQLDLPAAALSDPRVAQYFGTWRIVDDSAGPTFRYGWTEIDGGNNVLTFQIDNGTFATSGSPVALATDDFLSVQITYMRA